MQCGTATDVGEVVGIQDHEAGYRVAPYDTHLLQSEEGGGHAGDRPQCLHRAEARFDQVLQFVVQAGPGVDVGSAGVGAGLGGLA